MRLGVVILPDRRWSDSRPRWERAEEIGFDHAWTYDHVAWRTMRDEPWFAAVPTLAAAALVTTRIRLGPLVASPNFRHPVPFTKDMVALDDLSDGRLTVGVGAGGLGWDATVLGHEAWSRSERAERFAEFVHLTHALLHESAVSSAGTHYSAEGARTYPGTVQRPGAPMAIAAGGPAGMRLAAVYGDSWVTTGDPTAAEVLPFDDGLAVLAEQQSRVDVACAEVGRRPKSLKRIALTGLSLDAGLDSPERFRDAVGRYEEVGITDLVLHLPRERGPFAGDLDSFERVVADWLS